MASPLGEILLTGDESGLSSLSLSDQKGGQSVQSGWIAEPALFTEAQRQLTAYFAGELTRFQLDLRPAGTEFRRRVWEVLDTVPYGETVTYGEVAARIGASRAAVRAVGGAIGANPLLIVRPCHRVLGADGGLTGYAAGLDRKRRLLTLEGSLPMRP
ncbi:methylated-DNA--[protein]-cysteine S-methyltransferase [Streptomyces sp. NPDC006879]|uniref:methylated-DNA--[protein]-cysteine S-methyltransferase n=1 Tax=Streptomyces sp. NPDC006879 TaxID=3364767 RepID=UPI00368AA7DA